MCFTVASCCCGCTNLQTGSKAIAIFNIVTAILSMLGFAATGFRWYALLVQLQMVIVSGVLLYGASTRKSAFVIVWLILEMMNLIALFALAGASIGVAAYDTYHDSVGDRDEIVDFWSLGVVLMIGSIVESYLWTVVYSFNKELQSDNSSSYETGKGMRV